MIHPILVLLATRCVWPFNDWSLAILQDGHRVIASSTWHSSFVFRLSRNADDVWTVNELYNNIKTSLHCLSLMIVVVVGLVVALLNACHANFMNGGFTPWREKFDASRVTFISIRNFSLLPVCFMTDSRYKSLRQLSSRFAGSFKKAFTVCTICVASIFTWPRRWMAINWRCGILMRGAPAESNDASFFVTHLRSFIRVNHFIVVTSILNLCLSES